MTKPAPRSSKKKKKAAKAPKETSTAVVVQDQAHLAADADEYTAKRDLVIQMYFAGVEDMKQVEHCLYVGQKSGLSYLAKQIHAIPREQKVKGVSMTVLTPQTSIDGYRLIAERTGALAGIDDVVFTGTLEITYREKEWENNTPKWVTKTAKVPETASVTVRKLMPNGMIATFTASCRWSEYYPGDSKGFMWRDKPYLMLGKCAEALALRKGFPNNLSGLYTDVEMNRADARDQQRDQQEITQQPVVLSKTLPAPAAPAGAKAAPVKTITVDEMVHSDFMARFNDMKDTKQIQELYAFAQSPRKEPYTPDQKDGINVCYFRAVARAKSLVVQGEPGQIGTKMCRAGADGIEVVGVVADNGNGWIKIVAPESPAPVASTKAENSPTGGVQAGSNGGPATVPTAGPTEPAPAVAGGGGIDVLQAKKIQALKEELQIEDADYRMMLGDTFNVDSTAKLSKEQAAEMIAVLESQTVPA